MTILTFTLILLVGAYLAGLLGSLTGLGGGVVVIPLLTLGFGVDIRYAIGAALLASIATSSGSASAYVKEGITNIRLGMFLEIATTIGAVIGALIAVYTPTNTIAILFGIVLIFSAVMTLRKKNQVALTEGSRLSYVLKLNSTYPTSQGEVAYKLKNVGAGFSIMTVAGVLSGLLGIGSGALKVLAMDTTMRIPFKVSTTTSNFMIGVTAAASAVVYLQRGYIDPGIAFPVIIGVLGGAFTGSKLLTRMDPKVLRIIFCIAITFVAIEMIYNGYQHQF
ncbi:MULTISPECIES: sulfite exporter TauE/SafE family protein [unclassified Flavobacterium]|uniref:sulfite exporter TauE/SafE family protein n=1 Tax=unclassified Flavobacterium TaxID=196869 RepID=UPI000868A37D|nr:MULTISPECIES: sulfite exporter TauE/SafE family protein [unclassified Flavobacterium]MBN9284810.1 sulfite exporter TauE/SafE family protein [Flavobacterium sp.]ODS77358.1 MAG: permease [Chryseobacterium sp. SCN 40-13]OJV71306.1 MAG: permease [Flavobacterium sp. 40-81]